MANSTTGADAAAPDEGLPETAISRVFDGVINAIGAVVSWLWLVILIAIVGNVIWRYVLENNLGQLEELQWHLYSVAFLVGMSYCVVSDQHVRIDLLHGLFGRKTKAVIDLVGILVFALPFVFVIIRYGIPFAEQSFAIGERSPNPSGLPHRWLVKSSLIVGFGLIAVALVSRLTRLVACLLGWPAPAQTATQE